MHQNTAHVQSEMRTPAQSKPQAWHTRSTSPLKILASLRPPVIHAAPELLRRRAARPEPPVIRSQLLQLLVAVVANLRLHIRIYAAAAAAVLLWPQSRVPNSRSSPCFFGGGGGPQTLAPRYRAASCAHKLAAAYRHAAGCVHNQTAARHCAAGCVPQAGCAVRKLSKIAESIGIGIRKGVWHKLLQNL